MIHKARNFLDITIAIANSVTARSDQVPPESALD